MVTQTSLLKSEALAYGTPEFEALAYVFGIDTRLKVPTKEEHEKEVDEVYKRIKRKLELITE